MSAKLKAELADPTEHDFISLGAGVQSSAMLLMAAHGEITPTPQAAIFADTQDEAPSIYRWLDWLEAEVSRCPNPIPIHRVTRGRLSARALEMRVTADGRKYSKTDIPFHTLSSDGKVGMIPQRACTYDFKIKPILSFQRAAAKVKRGQKNITVTSWIGISLDEIYRMKPSREKWCQHRWPLVELGMKRHDCILWMERKGYPRPPRSSCVYCPFHSDAEWRRLRDEEPEAFNRAVEFERALQYVKSTSTNFSSTPFLHKQCVPLDQVDLSTDAERGQWSLWANECEGMCSV